MQNWKRFFQKHILERGYDYFETGSVLSLEKTENGYRAEVEGTEFYEVEIEMERGEVTDMFCSCPYAEDGNYCKHEAAVLFLIEGDFDNSRTDPKACSVLIFEDREKEQKALTEAVQKMTPDMLREFFIETAQQDENLKEKILLQYGTFGTEQIERLRTRIKDMGKVYRTAVNQKQFWDCEYDCDYDDEYDYDYDYDYDCDYNDGYGSRHDLEAAEFSYELCVFLDRYIPALLKRRFFEEAFELTNLILQESRAMVFEECYGEAGSVKNAVLKNWRDILSSCDENERQKIYRYLKSQRHGDYEDEISNFLIEEFHDKEVLAECLRKIDRLLRKTQKEQKQNPQGYDHSFCLISSRMDLMRKGGFPEKEIRAYRSKYRHLPEIRREEIQEALECKDYRKAIAILQESRQLDRENDVLIKRYNQQLIEIYRKLNDEEGLKTELLFKISNYMQHDLEAVRELKKLCSAAEWEQEFEKMLKSRQLVFFGLELLELEGQYDRLLAEILNRNSVAAMDKWEKTLREHFPDEIREFYVAYVRRASEQTSDRSEYRKLAEYLRKISRLPGGEDLAKQIAAEWKVLYKRRPAMMDELRKAGF